MCFKTYTLCIKALIYIRFTFSSYYVDYLEWVLVHWALLNLLFRL